jgi:hypothetical protein
MLANIRIGQRIAISIVLLLIVTVTTLTALFFSRFESLLADAERRELRGIFDNVSSTIAAESLTAERLAALVATFPRCSRRWRTMTGNDSRRCSCRAMRSWRTTMA